MSKHLLYVTEIAGETIDTSTMSEHSIAIGDVTVTLTDGNVTVHRRMPLDEVRQSLVMVGDTQVVEIDEEA